MVCKCDRCGKDVEDTENVLELQAIIREDPLLTLALNRCRHIKCSPSSAQWIIHTNFPPVKDNRPKYTKKQYSAKNQRIFENRYTKAWLKLLENKEDTPIDIFNMEE